TKGKRSHPCFRKLEGAAENEQVSKPRDRSRIVESRSAPYLSGSKNYRATDSLTVHSFLVACNVVPHPIKFSTFKFGLMNRINQERCFACGFQVLVVIPGYFLDAQSCVNPLIAKILIGICRAANSLVVILPRTEHRNGRCQSNG